MNLPPAISRAATLELITHLRTAPDADVARDLEQRIIQGNLRFCAYQARNYRQQGVAFEDLVAVAAAALLDAVRRFDPAKSNHFASYARRCIRRDLITTLRRQASPIRLPREPRRCERNAGREAAATPQGLPIEGSLAPTEHLVTEDPTDALLAAIDAECIAARVAQLPDREATVVRMRFGLDGLAPHDLVEIGVVLSLSKQRVQVILDRALMTLREALKEAA